MVDEVEQFFKQHLGGIIFSTSADVVYVEQDVFNVTGSDKDPKIGGKSWKTLLKENGIYGPCYVTNQKPDRDDTTHDEGKWLGGHMALTKDGIIQPGGDSYLMPLCSWHNHTKRDHRNFEHDKTKMLKLGGFMKGQNALTFHIRRKDLGLHRILIKGSQGWQVSIMDSLDAGAINVFRDRLSATSRNPYVVLMLDRSGEGLISLDSNI